MSHVTDLWTEVANGKRVKSPRHGKGLRYRVRWTDAAGKEKSKSFPDGQKGIADQFRTQTDNALLTGEYLDPGAGRVTLAEYAAAWLARQHMGRSSREATERRLRLHVLPDLGSRPLAQLSGEVIKTWLASLDAAPRSKQTLLGLLSAILGEAVDDGRISRNPCGLRSVKAPRDDRPRIVPWTAGQVSAIRDALPARYAAMVDCGAGLGLRQGEVLGLAVDDVDFLHRVVHVRRQVLIVGSRRVFGPPKRGKERDVPLPDVVGLRLAAHIAAFPPREVSLPWQVPGGRAHTAALLFASGAGSAVSRSNWNRSAWRPAIAAAGLPPGGCPGFTSCATFSPGRCSPTAWTSARWPILGHGDPLFTLRIYIHLMPASTDRMRQAVDRVYSTDGLETASREVMRL